MSSGPGSDILHVAEFRFRLDRDQLLLLFTSANLAFLSFDVAIAHSVNSFVPVYEWVPVLAPPFGAFTAFWLAIHRKPSLWAHVTHALLMLLNVIIGVMGFAFHLKAMLSPSGAFSWSWAVFSAPVLAPLSFAGVGLVGLYSILEEDPPGSRVLSFANVIRFRAPISKTQHLLWFTALGFLGAAATSFLDHGQYGYTRFEWIPVIAGIFATLVVAGKAVFPEANRADDVAYLWTMLAAIVVGIVGFAFHLSKDMADSGAISLERMRAYAPIFAPLLFANLAILGLLVMLSPRARGQ